MSNNATISLILFIYLFVVVAFLFRCGSCLLGRCCCPFCLMLQSCLWPLTLQSTSCSVVVVMATFSKCLYIARWALPILIYLVSDFIIVWYYHLRAIVQNCVESPSELNVFQKVWNWDFEFIFCLLSHIHFTNQLSVWKSGNLRDPKLDLVTARMTRWVLISRMREDSAVLFFSQ